MSSEAAPATQNGVVEMDICDDCTLQGMDATPGQVLPIWHGLAEQRAADPDRFSTGCALLNSDVIDEARANGQGALAVAVAACFARKCVSKTCDQPPRTDFDIAFRP